MRRQYKGTARGSGHGTRLHSVPKVIDVYPAAGRARVAHGGVVHQEPQRVTRRHGTADRRLALHARDIRRHRP